MRFVALAAAILLSLVAVWALWPQNPNPKSLEYAQDIVTSPIAQHEDDKGRDDISKWVQPYITYDSYQSQYGPLPASLQGTQIPFGMFVDENGRLIIDEPLRRFFDYFLTLDGEEPLDKILARIREMVTQYFPLPEQARALEILDQYVELKKQELALAAQVDADFKASGAQPDMAYLTREINDLRASHLDPEVYEGFFGQEARRDAYTLSRLDIQRDESLSEQDKQEALKAIEQYLPESDRQRLAEEREITTVYEAVDTAKRQGASEAEIFHLRSQAFGAEAAERYAVADKEIDTWDARVAAYREQRRAILESDGYSNADKEAEIDALREQHFHGNELKRIPVIDRMLDAEE